MIFLLIHEKMSKSTYVEKKNIAICSSYEKAKKTMERYKNYVGFKEFPNGFKILKYNIEHVNKDNHIYLLGYYREYEDIDDVNEILGLSVTLKEGKEIIKQYKEKNGFSIKARGFYIEKWLIDITFRWEGGFISVEEYLESIE
ncbi:hypothetical protein [Sebaldella sp. S0638]|uniref:hypothetical protein n=1 Tax=Sebaldella sp. S0638 TaxID=2957809 RepID=UPI0020A1906B|nr:hypothetical protein [Sebaldella sp. S0638]MCP1225896.1 hypothetical protein [Sebaldella sp. S0638]